MALSKGKFKEDLTTGFGTNSIDAGDRFYRKDGTVNVIRKGVNFFDGMSWYNTMISMPRWKFWLVLFTIYIIINLVFATAYLLIGIEHLGGVRYGSTVRNFSEAFFFSVQTYTTVGYGRINPVGLAANAIAAFEAFTGLLSFALASGLFYGRFSRPRAFLYFSDIALIAPFKDGKALMFRTVPYKNHNLTDVEVKVTLALREEINGVVRNQFYPLAVEYSRVNTLVLNWTIVHPINVDSPFYGSRMEDLKAARAEVLVFLKAYDEVFANSIVARTSYTVSEFIENARFKPMYHSSPTGSSTILHVDQLNDFELLS